MNSTQKGKVKENPTCTTNLLRPCCGRSHHGCPVALAPWTLQARNSKAALKRSAARGIIASAQELSANTYTQ
eukprot:12007-Eustigmatos_ZCMA.PRE.1